MIWPYVRLAVAAVLLVMGMSALFVTTVGIYRLHYVLNRIHVAAKCDTLGILLVLLSLAVMEGLSFTSLKLLLLIVFLWIANPVSSHLIAYLEVETNPKIEEECEVIHIDAD